MIFLRMIMKYSESCQAPYEPIIDRDEHQETEED